MKQDVGSTFFPHLPDDEIHNPAGDRFSDIQNDWIFLDPAMNSIIILKTSLQFKSPYVTHIDGATTVFDSRVRNRVFYELPVEKNRLTVFSEDGIVEHVLGENAASKILQTLREKRESGIQFGDFLRDIHQLREASIKGQRR